MSKRKRKRRQSLAGSRWRVMGPIEKAILSKLCLAVVKYQEKEERFLASVTDMPSISVRQKWYLACIASRYAQFTEFDQSETEWINDVLAQDCPEAFPKKTPYSEKSEPVSPVLIGTKRKIRE